MEAFLVSTVSVALAEIGDKTQLLALVLAARFRKPWPILSGMTLATLGNHGIAAALGSWISDLLAPSTLRWIIAASFIGMGLWILVPDTEDTAAQQYPYGAFLTTLVAFFLVEMGDKTQLATVLLAAKYQALPLVVSGSTFGMLLANGPVVLLGQLAAQRLPLRQIRIVAAGLFIVLGVLACFSGDW